MSRGAVQLGTLAAAPADPDPHPDLDQIAALQREPLAAGRSGPG